jgi:hypothetical protein
MSGLPLTYPAQKIKIREICGKDSGLSYFPENISEF